VEQEYNGSCHCGTVSFRVTLDLDEAFKCNCSLCRKKNAVIVRVPAENFALDSGEDQLGLYQWNTKIAKHYFCKNCGIYTHHRPRGAPEKFGVNVACLDDIKVEELSPRAADGAALSVV
jgi:hypothetical protein